MYAASSGETAKDGTGRNGVFTGQLLKNLKIPGLLLDEVLDRTGADVLKVSSNTQRPEISKQHYGKVYLGSIPTPPTPRPTPVAPTPAPTPKPAIVKDIRKIEAVQIDGGTFTMGSPAEEIGRDNDETEHKVTVSAFKIGKYPVTQREWQEIMGNNPSQFKGDNLPVENVSWYDAVEYCNRRSIAEGLTPAYNIDKHREDVNNKNSPNNDNIKWTVSWDKSANGYRLPTEAEWEYAAKAGNSSPFNTGNNITTSQANYDGSYPYGANAKGQNRQMTTAVGSFEPNAWGLYDMHGNVWEWCWDWHAKYSSTAQTDPDGATVGAGRALRGGSWFSIGEDLRSAYRNNNAPTAKSAYRGFRVVRR
jgi:formylglycine-generating enzyme required for sulfatase activity